MYPYGSSSSTGGSSPGPSTYSQYPDHQSNSQYPYGPSSTVNPNDYYSHYSFGAPQPTSIYGDLNGKFILD